MMYELMFNECVTDVALRGSVSNQLMFCRQGTGYRSLDGVWKY